MGNVKKFCLLVTFVRKWSAFQKNLAFDRDNQKRRHKINEDNSRNKEMVLDFAFSVSVFLSALQCSGSYKWMNKLVFFLDTHSLTQTVCYYKPWGKKKKKEKKS